MSLTFSTSCGLEAICPTGRQLALRPLLLAAAMLLVGIIAPLASAEALYNGIVLPSPWPPTNMVVAGEPMPVPYLTNPPPVIPIDVGRQLFVDDFLIESNTLKRTYHTATYHTNNPVLKPDKPWEMTSNSPCAMVFSDGVWYDPQDKLYKMWYMGGYTKSVCYATSTNGLDWQKPALDVVAGTNLLFDKKRDSSTVWLDWDEKDPAKRFKLFNVETGWKVNLYFSGDGIHWGNPVGQGGSSGDRTTVFYNPFRKVWVYSLRSSSKVGRTRRYLEATNVLAVANWSASAPVEWVGADRLDPPRSDLKTPCQLYNLDAMPYESLLVGLFSIWRGQPKDRAKPNEVCVGFSRDGFHWQRPDRRAFIQVSEKQGDWNWGNVQSAGGGCLVVARQLYFYVSGRAGIPGSSTSGVCATGLATLRRDGFASMDAEQPGVLTTRPLKFSGKYLFVNVNTQGGELRVEIVDANGQPIRATRKDGTPVVPFSVENCNPVNADSTLILVTWKDTRGVAPIAGRPVRFRFHLTKGSLYSFWVSPKLNGASHGYVAAGGPQFTGPTDTVGTLSYRK